MANLIPMEQAAEMLGMTVEKLTELRSNNEIFGYRDGQNWQFKMSELERVANELGVQLKDADEAPLLLDDDDDDLGFELSDSSTEISSADLSASLDEDTSKPVDGFNLDESSELALEDSGELLMLEGASDVLGSDEAAGDEEGLSFGSSDISLAASSKDLPSPSDTNALLADGSNLLDDEATGGPSPSDTGMMLAASDSLDGDDDDLFGDDLELIEDDSFEESAELSSDFEDSDLVLDDSDSSAEIVLAGGESGINLGKNASGIELDEEPLELGGSDIDSLELPEDDDELLELDDLGSGVGTLAQEDEFKLTALEEDLDDQSSGSQVIALEDSAIYSDEGEASILGSEELAAQPAMLPASEPGATPDGQVGSVFDQAGVATTGAVAVGGMGAAAMVPAAVEAPYTIWQVIGLGFVAALLLVGGMIGYDIARNLWMPEDQVISTGVMKFFLEITGLG